MNSSTFETAPSEAIINFYFWYSYITLFLSWLIAPLLFYVILTQSKNLDNFKWFILNHSIWCLALQTKLAVTKPLILVPALAGYPLALLRSGNYRSTVVCAILAIVLIVYCIASLFATLLCRYLLVFPSGLTQYFSKKLFIFIAVGLSAIMYLILGISCVLIFSTDDSTIQEWQQGIDDPAMMNFVRNEPAFASIPSSYAETPLLIAIIVDVIIIIFGLTCLILFCYLVTTLRTQTASIALKRSLLLSGIIQVLLVFVLLFFPSFLLMILLRFQVPHTANLICLGLCLVLTHSILEFLSTLIFVSPYRKFLKQQYSKIFLSKKSEIVSIQISQLSKTINCKEF